MCCECELNGCGAWGLACAYIYIYTHKHIYIYPVPSLRNDQEGCIPSTRTDPRTDLVLDGLEALVAEEVRLLDLGQQRGPQRARGHQLGVRLWIVVGRSSQCWG